MVIPILYFRYLLYSSCYKKVTPMLKFPVKDPRKAQGMVEFALALPVLLLLILGIFAFGHLFFVYSLVTSASREASRYGAAVGETDSGALRYQDCDGILAAAVR